MEMRQVLIDARRLIERPANWTKNYLSTDKAKNPCDLYVATRFCALGAIAKAAGRPDFLAYRAREEPAAQHLQKIMGRDVAAFNNKRTHKEVLAAFDKAIAALMDDKSGGTND